MGSFGLEWWITIVGIPLFGCVFTLIWWLRNQIDATREKLEKSISVNRRACDSQDANIISEFQKLQLVFATKYVNGEELKAVEGRIVSTLDKIDSKIDRLDQRMLRLEQEQHTLNSR